MPYSTRRGEYYPWNRGPHPVIEILIDGQPWGQIGAQTFRFGKQICKMLLSSRSTLENFLRVEGNNPESFNGVIPHSFLPGVTISVIGYSRFERSDGIRVSRPYLKFSCKDYIEKGIGLKKSDGLLSVWADLEAFARENHD